MEVKGVSPLPPRRILQYDRSVSPGGDMETKQYGKASTLKFKEIPQKFRIVEGFPNILYPFPNFIVECLTSFFSRFPHIFFIRFLIFLSVSAFSKKIYKISIC